MNRKSFMAPYRLTITTKKEASTLTVQLCVRFTRLEWFVHPEIIFSHILLGICRATRVDTSRYSSLFSAVKVTEGTRQGVFDADRLKLSRKVLVNSDDTKSLNAQYLRRFVTTVALVRKNHRK